MANCVRCRAENPSDARFCMACGAGLGISCDACGTALPTQALFCSNCGVATSQRNGDSTETIKLVTILFADVVGSTAQAETMRPEDTRALMAQFFDAMSEEILAEGGTVERIIGDAIMADFGVPIAREDDPVRAVRAARRMFTRLGTFNDDRSGEGPLQMRIGINTGAVSTGGSFGEQLLVMGDAVNVAARLEQAAAPGTILIGEKTARAVRHMFRLGRVEPVVAKGKSLPVQAFAVEEEVEEAEQSALRPAPLVGRETEMELLSELFDRCRRDRVQQVCTVIGDAGVGKSRLLNEFTSSIEEGAAFLVGRCPPYGDGLTLAPLQEVLRSEARIFPQDDAEASMTKVVRLVSNAAPDLSPSDALAIAAPLGSTIGLSPALESMSDLDPRVVYREMLRAWRLFLSALATSRPVVLIVEDVHWADQTLLDVLADLSEHIDGAFLLICSARAEFVVARSGWLSSLPGHVPIQLDALPRPDAQALVTELLGTSDLPTDLTERTLERAEGNPLFIEEFLLRLVDEGCLSPGPDGWRVTGDISGIEVPERVQTLIQARLDLLSPLEREVLQAAAVVGRHFWSGALEWVTGLPDAPDVIDRLKPRQMVVEQFSSSVPGDIEYAFRHTLIRDVVYENLPRKARARAHAATARWIESVRGSRADESAELLGEHYERAYEDAPEDALRKRARHYLLLAAGAAMRRFAVDQAERLGYRAVELSLPGEERAEALEGLGDAFHLALRGNPAWNAYTSALAEIDERGVDDAERVARLAAKASIVPTRWIGTLDEDVPARDIQRVIDLGLESAANTHVRHRVLLLSARAFLAGTVEDASLRDDVGAENAAREAVALAQGLGDVNLVSTAMDAVGVLLWPTGRFREITQIDRDRLQLLPELSDIREIADILLSAGRDLTRVGEYLEALEYLDRAVATVENLDAGQYLHCLVHRSATRCALGLWDGAVEDLARIERLETLPSVGGVPPSYAVRAYGAAFFCSQMRGDGASAERHLAFLRAHFSATHGVASDALDPLALAARALARAGHLDEAMSWLSFGRWTGLPEHLEAACDIVGLAGQTELAESVLADARREVRSGGLLALEHFADRLEGQMMVRRDEIDAGVRLLLRSAEGFGGLQAVWEEAWSRLLAAEVLVEHGQSTLAEIECERALQVFTRLGSIVEVHACRELVSRVAS